MFRRPTVADFLLDKDPLFARLNLSDDEYALYEKVYAHLKPQTPTPDLVIYLQAPVDTLIERVHRRGVDFERAIPGEYLARLADAYSRFFYQYDEAPLLIVNSERLNFVDNPRARRAAAARASPRCAARREFFNLGASDQATPYIGAGDYDALGIMARGEPMTCRTRADALANVCQAAAWRSCRRWAICTTATCR